MVTSTVGFSNVAMVPEASLLEWLNKLALPSHWHSIFYSQSGLATRFAKGYRLLTLNRLFNRFVVTGTGTDSKNE